jgi:pyrimidine-nucleoside phosphorylase
MLPGVNMLRLICIKRDGGEVPADALTDLVLAYARGEVPDYQVAAFLMAGYLNGFSRAEAEALTAAMVASGRTLDLSALSGPTVDKHSTGGVSDGTTLVVAPLAAALGMQVMKLSGRGLGHTGGTLDKLESIPGLAVERSPEDLLEQVERVGLAVAAQSADLVPADRALYALRDATGTVASTALIASSVMSKKLAGGASVILLDVKAGDGAFMKDPAAATELAELCVDLGRRGGRVTAALVTDMSQPLGNTVGNAIEVREAVQVLRGEGPERLTELSLTLTGHLATLAKVATDPAAGRATAEQALARGDGLERFRRFVEAQGGDPRAVDDPSLLPAAPVALPVPAPASGWLATVACEQVGLIAAGLGAGRQRKEDSIDPAVGLEVNVKIGDHVERGEPVGTVHARDRESAERAAAALARTLGIVDERTTPPALVIGQVIP